MNRPIRRWLALASLAMLAAAAPATAVEPITGCEPVGNARPVCSVPPRASRAHVCGGRVSRGRFHARLRSRTEL